jgi:hypothetical protein
LVPFRFRSIALLPSLVFATLFAMHGCVEETLDEVDSGAFGAGGSVGTSGGDGSAGTFSAGGVAGTFGAGGVAGTFGAGGVAGTFGAGGLAGRLGTGGVPGTCAEGVPAANYCTQGTLSVGSVVQARGLSSLEGRVVRAAFSGGKRTTTVVSGGAFDLDFLLFNGGCNLGASSFAAGAFYIDADNDGACDPAVDRIFVWGASGGPPGTCATIQFTPQSPPCQSLYYGTSAPALSVAQSICPAVGSCLSFCGPLNEGAGGTPGVCADGGAVDASGS